jgi:hypothetical protein
MVAALGGLGPTRSGARKEGWALRKAALPHLIVFDQQRTNLELLKLHRLISH